MAFMSQEKKKALTPKIKAILKKYKMQGSLSVQHHATLVLTLKSGVLDLERGESQINSYWLKEHYQGKNLSFLEEIREAMNKGNFDNSNILDDFFHVGWYINISVGKWGKPYILIEV